ncbi:MAG: glucose-1-phosphate adenylyltransferase [Candidatus Omnitrophica bacterium]|nr:glucose-1-phosphate adenylyltransferase [Candidatus Omnitrophota bacterium]
MKTSECIVLILGGGKGERLFPLTLERSKPAIGFAGKYRLIDIPVSNCINSGFNKIFVLTQFLSASLHAHIMHTYRFDNFTRGFVEILSAEQSHKSSEWFQGTADAVRHVLRHLRNMPQELVLILSGDHLYRMDYRELVNFHIKKKAEATIASIFIDDEEASRMGILDYSADGQVKRIIEKPSNVSRLKIHSKSRENSEKSKKQFCASMGIYLFNKNILFDILTKTKTADFGKHILPFLLKKKHKVFAYEFKGYWRDIGTIKSYYEASMDLLESNPEFELYDEKFPLLTRARLLPPTKVNHSTVINSLIADGCVIGKSTIENSIIGLRSRIMEDTKIKDSIIVGNDYYQNKPRELKMSPYIGKGVIIERAIVDKNATISDFCHIRDKKNSANKDGDLYYIRDGITVIRRGAVLPARTII